MNLNLKNAQQTSEVDVKITPQGAIDLPDSLLDAEKLMPETATILLPDVKDIPGQEFIHPAPLGEMADTTTASDDEEGIGLFNDEEEFTGNDLD